MDTFHLDRERARAALSDPDAPLWPVNDYSDADELNGLFDAALDAGLITREQPRARILIYPLSISEPDPLLAVIPPQGPTLLGYGLKLREREGETPLDFTLRVLEETTAEANALLAQRP